MRTRVAINGVGRIGRAILKLVVDEPSLELVAVNDLVDAENLAYLLRFDTVYGRYSKPVAVDGDGLVVGGRKLRALTIQDPADLPWKDIAKRRLESPDQDPGPQDRRFRVGNREDRPQLSRARDLHVGKPLKGVGRGPLRSTSSTRSALSSAGPTSSA